MRITKEPDVPEFPPLLSDEEIEERVPDSKIMNQPNQRHLTDKELTDEAFAVLKTRFARIHQNLLMLWGTAQGEAYLNDLLIDDRGNRQGFPPEVLHALLILQRVHFQLFGTFKKVDRLDIGWTK